MKRRTEGISTTKAQRHKEEMAEATEGRGTKRRREGATKRRSDPDCIGTGCATEGRGKEGRSDPDCIGTGCATKGTGGARDGSGNGDDGRRVVSARGCVRGLRIRDSAHGADSRE